MKRVFTVLLCVTIPFVMSGGVTSSLRRRGSTMQFLHNICTDDQGQDVAEYAVMLAVILVLVIGTVRLIGGNANNAFSSVASSLRS